MRMFVRLDGESSLELSEVGGKGFNLNRLAGWRFPVPPAFAITTRAYRGFVEKNSLQKLIQSLIEDIDISDTRRLAEVEEALRAAFLEGEVDGEFLTELERYYGDLGGGAVAVRSSATAEDLPGLSFAGQQESFLNVRGIDSLVRAVKGCWASLWTSRAIAYRRRNRISSDGLALAVVVQRMVEADSSGVLFTADPRNGDRKFAVVEAVFGLGESLVSGKTEPDYYRVRISDFEVVERRRGEKALEVVSSEGGGTEERRGRGRGSFVLGGEELAELVKLGVEIGEKFGFPQDVEWAFSGGELWIVQSRPITTLYPLPSEGGLEPLKFFFSVNSVQGIKGPISPLGRDILKLFLSGVTRVFGVDISSNLDSLLAEAGERLFIELNWAFRYSLTRERLFKFLKGVDPQAYRILEFLHREGELPQPAGRGFRLLFRLGKLLSYMSKGLRRAYFSSPARVKEEIFLLVDGEVERVASKLKELHSPREVASFCRSELPLFVDRWIFPEILPLVLSAVISLQFLKRFFPKGEEEKVWVLTRGVSDNVTAQMDLELWSVVEECGGVGEVEEWLNSNPPEVLARDYLEGRAPKLFAEKFGAFLEKYGVRGPEEIDVFKPRWREEPTPLFSALKSYGQLSEGGGPSPKELSERGHREARELRDALLRRSSGGPVGWIVRPLIERSVRAIWEYMGLRELPKFTMVRIFGVLRDKFLELGEELAVRGVITEAEGIFFLKLEELFNFEDMSGRFEELVEERRSRFQYEERREVIPRILLSDGRFWERAPVEVEAGGEEGRLRGMGVSPGRAEGRARVLASPVGAELKPGEILVCHGTDPSWTPLFLTAGGLVTEVGGVMTHGSVVAREYGIPAVVGVSGATESIREGELIRVDGYTGVIELLDRGQQMDGR